MKIILSFKLSHLKAHSLVSKLAAKLDSSLSELQATDLLTIIEPLAESKIENKEVLALIKHIHSLISSNLGDYKTGFIFRYLMFIGSYLPKFRPSPAQAEQAIHALIRG